MTPGTTASRDILLVTVQYGNFGDTSALVASLGAADDVDTLEMVIVDNGPSPDEGELEALKDAAPFAIRVLRPGTNLYYWGGAARGIELVSKANDLRFRWTIICNNDVMIEDPSFFRRLRALDVRRYPIVAPTIVDAVTGRDQNPLLATPPRALKRLKWSLHDLHYRIAQSMLWANNLFRRFKNGTLRTHTSLQPPDVEQRIYAPHGAFVILSSAFFEKGATLDTTLSMYGEELSLAATARRLQLPVWHRRDLRVIHKPHSTTGATLTREKYQMERQARRHYYRLIAGGGIASIALTEPSRTVKPSTQISSDSISRQ